MTSTTAGVGNRPARDAMASSLAVTAGDLVLIGRLDLPEPFIARVLWLDGLDVLTEQHLPGGLHCRRLSTTSSILAVGDLSDLEAIKALWTNANPGRASPAGTCPGAS